MQKIRSKMKIKNFIYSFTFAFVFVFGNNFNHRPCSAVCSFFLLEEENEDFKKRKDKGKNVVL